jgi:hypothetical protein
MIRFELGDMEGEVASLMRRFDALPNHIARKHVQAAVKRVMKYAVPVLKKNTPRRGKRVIFHRQGAAGEYGATKMKGGSLRQSVAAKSEYKRTKRSGATVTGIVGYRSDKRDPYNGVSQSRKAIWLEFGTDTAFARGMAQMTMRQIGGPSAAKLAAELAVAIEKAGAELASKMNPGMSARGRAAGL